MPKILVVASGKGGSGKSTHARNIIPLALAAGLRVAAYDTDPQKTLLTFLAARAKKPVAQCQGVGSTLEEVTGLARASGDVDLVIIDTPTALEEHPAAVKELLLAADLILIPSQPAIDDVSSVKTLMATAQGLGRTATFVLNRVDTRVREVEGARHMLLRFGPLLSASLSATVDIQRAMVQGLGITEVRGRGGDDMEAIWAEVSRLLGLDDVIQRKGAVVNG